MMIPVMSRIFVLLSVAALPLFCNAYAVETTGEEQSAIAAELQNAHKVIRGLPNQRFVTIFGSARIEDGPIHRDVERLGSLLVSKNYAVLTGGGPGLMNAAGKGALSAGGTSLGCAIYLPFEKPSDNLSCLVMFRHFQPRKICLINYACAIVVCPGGMGTLDELFETITLMQTGKMNKIPVVLLNRKYWSGLCAWIGDTLLPNGVISPGDINQLFIADTPEEAVECIVSRHKDGIVHGGFGYPTIK